MSERGPLAIVEGRHPLMEQLQGSGDLVPNDPYLPGVHPLYFYASGIDPPVQLCLHCQSSHRSITNDTWLQLASSIDDACKAHGKAL